MNTIFSRTKIIATIGPASSPKEVLRDMFIAGVDVCRLNFSHGSYDDHKKVIDTIRALNLELGLDVAIIADLQGPKLRVGDIENGEIELKQGSEIEFTSQKCVGTTSRVYLSYKQFPQDVKQGDMILIDDGKLKLEVVETNEIDTVRAKVIFGGLLRPKKGVNLPHTKVSLPSLTDKDISDANFALDHDVDWIALSFVRTATDILELKDLIKQRKKHTPVIAKIEKPEALSEIENIIDVADAVMVARGDMGVEIDFEKVPLIQKHIVNSCITASKPVIIATQMLESMITNFRPTRAEASDVANAVLDGADTLMLSGETSVGSFPVTTIQSMHKIIQWTEDHAYNYHRGEPPMEFSPTFLSNSICFNAVKMASQTKATAIITFTHSGFTALHISGFRPQANIYAFTDNKDLIPRLSLLWGVRAFYFAKYTNIDDAIAYTISELKNQELIHSNDIVIHVASTPLHLKDKTNMLKLSYI